MKRNRVVNIAILLLCTMLTLPGCAAISHMNMDVQAKMSDTIFLNPEVLESGKPIYVRVTNTSDFSGDRFREGAQGKNFRFWEEIGNKPEGSGLSASGEPSFSWREEK